MGKVELKLIAYYRVSTDKQGRSKLGLEAQEAAVESYRRSVGGRLIKAYEEVESGKRSDRPELAKALEHARRAGARLVVAKLDRLTRNSRLLMGLVESGADLVFCDLPDVPPGPTGKFILTQMAAVAELEGGLISERTKAALAALQARGVKLGAANPKCRGRLDAEARERGRERGTAAAAAKAAEHAAFYRPIVAELRGQGMTLEAIADELNRQGYLTLRKRPWSHVQVKRLLDAGA